MKETYIYIKTHNITELKYFGKTTKKDIETYKGSGKYWKRHIKKHGYNCRTYKIKSFTNKQECMDFCLWFSKINNIIKSKKWANLVNENGIDGCIVGYKHSRKARINMRNKRSEEHKNNIRLCRLGKKHSEETKMKMRKPHIKVICPYCNKEGGIGSMKRWHFNNCKNK